MSLTTQQTNLLVKHAAKTRITKVKTHDCTVFHFDFLKPTEELNTEIISDFFPVSWGDIITFADIQMCCIGGTSEPMIVRRHGFWDGKKMVDEIPLSWLEWFDPICWEEEVPHCQFVVGSVTVSEVENSLKDGKYQKIVSPGGDVFIYADDEERMDSPTDILVSATYCEPVVEDESVRMCSRVGYSSRWGNYDHLPDACWEK